jgi:uncharacterized membrane protein
MSDLIVVSFDGEDTADQVLNKLRALQSEHLVDLEDAVEARLRQALEASPARRRPRPDRA